MHTWWGSRFVNFNVVALLLVLVLHAADPLRSAPDYLTYFNVNPALYSVRAQPLEPNEPAKGKVIIGASALTGQVLPDPNSYRWLLNYQPVGMLDRSMFMYDVK